MSNFNHNEEERFVIEEILEQLRQGRSMEDIGNDFAEKLNKAKATYDKEIKDQEEEKKAAELVQKCDGLAIILYDAIEYLDKYYPKLISSILPNDEYDLDKMARELVHTIDSAYDMVYNKGIDFSNLEKALEEIERLTDAKGRNNREFESILDEFLKS